MFRLQIEWFIHSYFQSPHLTSCPTKQRRYIRSPSTEPHTFGIPAYSGVRPGSQGYRLRHCSYYTSTMQPSARYLPPWLGRPEPIANVCLSDHLQVSPPHLLPLHVTQGTDLHVTLRYGRGVGFVGCPTHTYANWYMALKSCSFTDNTVIQQITRQ